MKDELIYINVILECLIMSLIVSVHFSHLFILLIQRPRKINNVDRYGGLKGVVNGCNVQKGPSNNRPSKPRELLYSRHINQVQFFILYHYMNAVTHYVRGCAIIANINFI